MKRFYSKSTGLCYLEGIHTEMPADAVEIDDQRFVTVLGNTPPGKVVGHNEAGLPILVDAPPPSHDFLCLQVRKDRDSKLSEIYDRGVQIAYREMRLAESDEQKAVIEAKLVELDLYAKALCDIPDQPGFPTDVEWPEEPTTELGQ